MYIYDKPDKASHHHAMRDVLEDAERSKTFFHNLPVHKRKVSFLPEDGNVHERGDGRLLNKTFHKFYKQMVSKLAELIHEEKQKWYTRRTRPVCDRSCSANRDGLK